MGGPVDPADPVDPAYPRHWEADVVLADGGTIHVRPIRPDDGERLRALHSRLSERTRYLRFFSPYPRMPDRDLARFTHVDYDDRVALVGQLGPDIVAVGRYERTAARAGGEVGDAEVAFVVQDDQQGRGIGSVLLEHLAAAARERGVRRFVADVLAENPLMVRVFLDAGYRAEREYGGGVIHLTFPIEPTESLVAVAHEREQRAEARSIERLLTPRSVAVIGASTTRGKVGHEVFGNLLRYGFAGPVYPVHATARHVSGVRAYPSVLDVPDEVDLAVIAVPGPAVAAAVEQCARKGVKGLVVLSGGFGERDAAGRRAERDLVTTARASGMRLVGPNCLGVINTADDVRLNASLAALTPDLLGRGNVGFFSQSGALGIAILEEAARRGLGLTSFVSAGNRVDVSGNDLLQYWESDPATDVVLLYLESFGNPRKFARLAKRLARRKPVVAVKSTMRGGAPPALAATDVRLPDRSVQALFEASGLIRVQDVSQLFDVAQLLAYQPLPAGRTVAIVGNASALGVLAADACLSCGLSVAEGSPVDIGPEGSADQFAEALGRALRDSAVDMVLAVFVPPLATDGEEFSRALAEQCAGSGKPVASTFLATVGVPAALRVPGPGGMPGPGSIPSYPSPERAAFALARVAGYASWRTRPAGTVPRFTDVRREEAADLVAGVLDSEPAGRVLRPAETGELLAAYGIELAGTGTDPAAVHAVVAGSDDPSFGALVSFGLGGAMSELLGDRAYAAVPLSDVDAAEMVRAPRAAPMLSGYGGAEPADLAALEQLVLRVSQLLDDLPEVLDLELDPVMAGAGGSRVHGARVSLGPATARVDPGPRRMR